MRRTYYVRGPRGVIAELPIVETKKRGVIVEIAGTTIYVPDHERLKGHDPGALNRQIWRIATRSPRGRGVVTPCQRAGRGPSDKSQKVRVTVWRKSYTEEPDETYEKRTRTITVPKSQICHHRGMLHVASWCIADKLQDDERLPYRRWLYAPQCLELVKQWFQDAEDARAAAQASREAEEQRRKQEKERLEREARNSIAALPDENRKRAEAAIDAGTPPVAALSSEEQAMATEAERARVRAREKKRLERLDQVHDVSVRVHGWKTRNRRHYPTSEDLSGCSLFYSGDRVYIVQNGAFERARWKSRSNVEIL